jgi:hypothetical protein
MALAALFAAACGLFDAPPPAPTAAPSTANFLKNGGLSQAEGWSARNDPAWSPFTISDSIGHSGMHSLALRLRGDESATGTHIAGAMQTLTPAAFPEYVSGFYRVDEWNATAPFQYLEVAVRVNGGDFPDGGTVHEVRLALAGASRDPEQPWNARYVFLSRNAPVQGRWIYFGYSLRHAFASRMGHLPEKWDSIDISFEARYDGKTAGAATSADVYYDDLYAGPQVSNPNRPPDP